MSHNTSESESDNLPVEDSVRIFSRFVYRMQSSCHPVLFSHVLIRLGHEPMEPRLANTPTSFAGLSKPVYMYPWIGSYTWHLIRSLGVWKAFTVGLPCSFLSSALMTAAEEAAFRAIRAANWRQYSAIVSEADSDPDSSTSSTRPPLRRTFSLHWALRSISHVDIESMRSEQSDMADVIDLMAAEPSSLVYLQHLMRLLLWRGYGLVISHPFRVVMVRQMAYAVCGGETPYRWFPQAIREVYRQNGVAGFFQGLIPSLLADLLVLSSVISVYRVLRLYFFRDFDPAVLHSIRSILWLFHSHYVQEPLRLVSDVLSLRGAGLALPADQGEVASGSWINCWDYLVNAEQLLRGSNWFFRRHIRREVLKRLPEI